MACRKDFVCHFCILLIYWVCLFACGNFQVAFVSFFFFFFFCRTLSSAQKVLLSFAFPFCILIISLSCLTALDKTPETVFGDGKSWHHCLCCLFLILLEMLRIFFFTKMLAVRLLYISFTVLKYVPRPSMKAMLDFVKAFIQLMWWSQGFCL